MDAMPEATPAPLQRHVPLDRRQLEFPPPAITAPLEATVPRVDDTVYAMPAGLLRRCLATFIDLFISAAIAAGLVLAFQRGGLALAVPWYPILILWGVLIASGVGASAMFLSGRSVGRRLTGLHLVDKEGRVPTVGRLLARSALSLLSVALFGAGLWLILFDRRGRSLHDLLTGTFLIQKSSG